MSRRSFLAAGVLATPVAKAAFSASTPPMITDSIGPALLKNRRKRNVLFISTDDMCNRLGCYGVPIIQSPNLDRLSRRGVRFDHHYCQFPLCGPSRTSLMTGLAPDTTRVWDLHTDFRDTVPGTVTLSQLFAKNGYFTARAGKIYHYNNPSEIGTPGFDDPASWQKTSNPAGYDRIHDEALVKFFASREKMYTRGRGSNIAAHASIQQNRAQIPWKYGGKGPSGIRIAQDGCTPLLPLSQNGDLGVPLAGHASDGDDAVITDYMVAESAIAMIEEHKDEPWFIAVGFYRPHVPFIVPSKYYDMYQVDALQIPPFAPSELAVAPRIAYTSAVPNYGMSLQEHREALQGYYASISFVDAQVGRLLDAVERLSLTKNTTIVFWSDHGFMVGEHGQWEKMMLFEPSARVPFIMAGAGVPVAGRSCNRTTEHLDIYPTLAEICKLEGVPAGLQGRSIVSLLENPDAAWEHPAVTQVTRRGESGLVMGYSIRRERHRYTMWAEGVAGEELYDYQEDPRELKNLAMNSISADLLAKLRFELERIVRTRRRINHF